MKTKLACALLVLTSLAARAEDGAPVQARGTLLLEDDFIRPNG